MASIVYNFLNKEARTTSNQTRTEISKNQELANELKQAHHQKI